MSIEGLYNHQVRIWALPAVTNAFNDRVPTPTPLTAIPTTNNAWADQDWLGAREDRGAGEEEARLRRWFLHKDLTVSERNVVQVLAGEEVGKTYRVMGLTKATDRNGLHHYEANCEEWEGSLEEAGS